MFSRSTIRSASTRFAFVVSCAVVGVSLVSGQTTGRRSTASANRGSYLRGRAGARVCFQAYGDLIVTFGKQFGVDPNLVGAVILAESNGDPRSVSSTGAKGLMQLMPGTCIDFGVSDPFDPQQNIRGGTALLAYNLRRYHGDVSKALAAYNAGPRRVDDGTWVNIAETARYVPTVLSYYRQLSDPNAPAPAFTEVSSVGTPSQPAPMSTIRVVVTPRAVEMKNGEAIDGAFTIIREMQRVVVTGPIAENGVLDNLADDVVAHAAGAQAQADAWLANGHSEQFSAVTAYIIVAKDLSEFQAAWRRQPISRGSMVGISHSVEGTNHVWAIVVGTVPPR